MGKAVTRYVADDGTDFSTKREMDLYELRQVYYKEIEVFITEVYKCSPRKKTEYINVVKAWQDHLVSQEYDTMDDVVEEQEFSPPRTNMRLQEDIFDNEEEDPDFANATLI